MDRACSAQAPSASNAMSANLRIPRCHKGLPSPLWGRGGVRFTGEPYLSAFGDKPGRDTHIGGSI